MEKVTNKGRRTYTLKRVIVLPTSLDKAWEFFSNPRNLTFITPPEMNFEINSALKPGEFYPGLLIEYVVRPIAGIPMKWVSEIRTIEERKQFHDVQISGPYASWHHCHVFREVPGGIEMSDIVEYQMPYGFLGVLAHHIFVRRKLEYIFDFRTKRIQFLFRQRTESGSMKPAIL